MNNKLFWKIIFVGIPIFFAFTGAALADDLKLDMEGTTASIAKGNTVERKITGIPLGVPGTLKLKLKWNARAILPTYNTLKIEVQHRGSTIVRPIECYSIHADETQKCIFSVPISQDEANLNGDWKLKATNNSEQEVVGFNIEKESGELNFLIPSFKSVFTTNCPDSILLDLEGSTLTLQKGNTAERKILGMRYSIGGGVLRLKLKWHAFNFFNIPTYNKLKIELFDSNQNRVDSGSGSFFSIHAPSDKTPKYDLVINVTTAQKSGNSDWKLVVTNNSDQDITGFNLRNQGDFNPLVPQFDSSFKIGCVF